MVSGNLFLIFLLVAVIWIESSLSSKISFKDFRDDPHHPPSQFLTSDDSYGPDKTPKAKGAAEWYRIAQDALRQAVQNQELNQNRARNVIIMIGDGMNIAMATTTRLVEGLDLGLPGGEEHFLSFEKFPYVSVAKSYNADWQTGDSAGCGTAILCGVKCGFSTLGVDDTAIQQVCESEVDAAVDSILYWAQDAGKSTGVVTTTAITHATPASAYASTVSRYWESDANQVLPGHKQCPDIAMQFIERGANITVGFGGGRSNFFPETVEDPEEPGKFGNRQDGRNLINEYIVDKMRKGSPYAVVHNKQDMLDVHPDDVDYMLGLFDRGHLSYDHDLPPTEPSLSNMTEMAIRILDKNPEGYFLMVEGGKIDHAHHDSRASRAVSETRAFAAAVQVAVDLTDEEDTLIIVTSDHAHSYIFGGDQNYGANPLEEAIDDADDGMPHTVVGYSNGPGFDNDAHVLGRENITLVDTTSVDYSFQSGAPLDGETHGGEDVPIYARGPMAHLFQGVQEQHYITHAAGYAACMGPNLGHCEPQQPK